MRGKNLSGLEVTPAMIHVRHATKIASEVTEGWFIPLICPLLPHHTKTVPQPKSLSTFTPFIL